MSGPRLTDEQVERYSRNILLPEIGGAGQRKLLGSSAFVVGAGGLGSPALLYLAAAGVGRLGVADSDAVDLTNLQRQILHGTAGLGRNKALSARDRIRELNPDCRVDAVPERLRAGNVRQALRGYDVVLDGSDNFATRFLVSDCCWLDGIPLVTAAVVGFAGQLMTVSRAAGSPCYRCFLPEPPPARLVPTCAEAGVLGAAAGVMGALQAVEAVKVLLGVGDTLAHRLLVYDALDGTFRTAERVRNRRCSLCGESPTITDVAETQEAPCCTGGNLGDISAE